MTASQVWFLYLVRTARNTLYTGITKDPQRRLEEHSGDKRGARALRGKGPLELAFVHGPIGRRHAAQLEAAVKALDRSAKEEVVAGRRHPDTLLAERQGELE